MISFIHARLFVAVLCIIAPSAFTARAAVNETPLRISQISLRTDAGAIRADVFELEKKARRPVVLVLHGAGGMMFDGPEMRRVSRHLAQQGNAVYLLHYFNSTGTPFALRGATM